MTKKITIVQNVPTQFDVPLYQKIANEQPFKLIVYYTQTYLTNTQNAQYDQEIGRSPQWDHIKNAQYDRRDLTETEAKSARLTLKRVLADKPDFVLVSGFYPRLHARLAVLLKLQGIPIGLRSDNTIPHSNLSGFRGWLKRSLQRYWLRLYDTWHPVGTLAHEYLKQVSGTTKPTYFFPYNVDNDWFAEKSAQARSQRNSIRESLRINPNAYVVLGIMKWHPREDPLTLVEAFREFHQTNPETGLILVGDGMLRPEIERIVEPIQDAVVLPGYVSYSELSKFYGISDIFVHSAVNEPWGVSVNEALACGLPVITSDGVGASYDLIIDKENFIFSKQDIKSLTKLLRYSFQDYHLKNQNKHQQSLIKKWSYKTTIESFLNVLNHSKT